MTETQAAFIAHVRKLERLAIDCPDPERREDAIRSLACMVLLRWPEEPDDGGVAEIIDLLAWRRAA